LQEDVTSAELPSIRMTRQDGKEVQLQRQLLNLLGHSLTKGIALLLQVATQQSSKVTTAMRIRSLNVLFQLATPQDLPDGVSWEALQSYMCMLLYLADFEELRIPQTIREFDASDKEALARSLWVNHGTEPKAIQLICHICLDHRVGDVNLWEGALTQLEAFGMHDYLLSILQRIGKVGVLSQLKCLPVLWNKVISATLTKVLDNASDGDLDKLVNIVQACPFVLGMDTISKGLAGMLTRGVPVLVAMSRLGRSQDLATALSAVEDAQLLAWLDELGSGVEQEQVSRLLLQTLNHRGAYSLLESTRHLSAFIQLILDLDDLDGLIMWMVERDDARLLSVMNLYLTRYPERLIVHEGLPSNLSMLLCHLEAMLEHAAKFAPDQVRCLESAISRLEAMRS